MLLYNKEQVLCYQMNWTRERKNRLQGNPNWIADQESEEHHSAVWFLFLNIQKEFGLLAIWYHHNQNGNSWYRLGTDYSEAKQAKFISEVFNAKANNQSTL